MITPAFGLTATERVLPKLALDFTTASLDARVTFTRTTGAANPATYVDSNGYIVSATNNQPRFDYDSVTLACKGLLIEESRTNLFLQSQDLSTTWVNIASSEQTDVAVSPDGTTNADKFIIDNGIASGSSTIYQSITKAATATTYTVSVYVKPAEYNSCRFVFRDTASAANNVSVYFNAATGAVASGPTAGGTFTAGTASISNAGNGWYRCTLTATTSTEISVQLRLYAYNNGTGSVTGNGSDGIYLWGAQLETGAFATSYIPTTTAALTRNADVATMTGTNFSDWFNASEGTFEFQGEVKALVSGARFLGVSDGTSTNRMEFLNNLADGKLRWYSSGGVASDTANAMTANVVFGASGAYKLNDYATALNGGATVADTSATVPAVNQMRIGYSTTTGSLNGWMLKIMYFPQRLINAEVQSFSKV